MEPCFRRATELSHLVCSGLILLVGSVPAGAVEPVASAGLPSPLSPPPAQVSPEAASTAAVREALRGAELVAVEPVRGEAIFLLNDLSLKAISEGQNLGDIGATLVEVLADRVVLRLDLEGRRRSVWMYPPADPNQPGVLRVFDLDAPALAQRPATVKVLELTSVSDAPADPANPPRNPPR